MQANSGTLVSDFVTITVLPSADSLVLIGPADQIVPVDSTQSDTLDAMALTNSPPGPAVGVSIVYTLVEPVFVDPSTRTVQLSNGALADTVITGADGRPSVAVTLQRVGTAQPDSAVVEISATHRSGAPVAGSGQRFVIRF